MKKHAVFMFRNEAACKRLGGGGGGAGAALTRHRGIPSGLCWWLCWLRREREAGTCSLLGGVAVATDERSGAEGIHVVADSANNSLPVSRVAMECEEGC